MCVCVSNSYIKLDLGEGPRLNKFESSNAMSHAQAHKTKKNR